MIYYNIYKHINGEKILIKTVNDIRKVSFIDNDIGVATYSVSKVDSRGESESISGNTVTLIGSPKDCYITEENTRTILHTFYKENVASLVKIEKSYDYINWIKIYDGNYTDLELEKETQKVYYRYYLYLVLDTKDLINTSQYSNIVIYNPLETKDLKLKVRKIDNDNINISWSTSYYLQYKLYINNIEYNTYDNSINNINYSIIDNITEIKLEAFKGMKYNIETFTYRKDLVPSIPDNLFYYVYDKHIKFKWNKKENETYTLKMNDEIIMDNKAVDSFYYILPTDDYYTVSFNLIASNNIGDSEPKIIEITTIPKPNPITFENIVDDNYNSLVKINIDYSNIYSYLPDIFRINIYTSELKDKYYIKVGSLYIDKSIYNESKAYIVLPKHLMKEYFKIKFTTNYISSSYSDIVRYYKPKPVKPKLDYKKIGKTPFNINTYLFSWEGHESDMSYSIYKNAVLMNKLPNTVHNYTMSVLPNEIVCVHSHIGYENIESNDIYIEEDNNEIITNKLNYFSFNNNFGSFNTGFLRS